MGPGIKRLPLMGMEMTSPHTIGTLRTVGMFPPGAQGQGLGGGARVRAQGWDLPAIRSGLGSGTWTPVCLFFSQDKQLAGGGWGLVSRGQRGPRALQGCASLTLLSSPHSHSDDIISCNQITG